MNPSKLRLMVKYTTDGGLMLLCYTYTFSQYPMVKRCEAGFPSWLHTFLGFWTVVLEKTLESPLDCKGIQPVHHKGDQSWLFIGRTDAEAEIPTLCQPDAKNWLSRKSPDAWKDWKRQEKGMTEDEMVGWHHWHDGHEFEQAPGVGEGQGCLACWVLWVSKSWTQLRDWTDTER